MNSIRPQVESFIISAAEKLKILDPECWAVSNCVDIEAENQFFYVLVDEFIDAVRDNALNLELLDYCPPQMSPCEHAARHRAAACLYPISDVFSRTTPQVRLELLNDFFEFLISVVRPATQSYFGGFVPICEYEDVSLTPRIQENLSESFSEFLSEFSDSSSDNDTGDPPPDNDTRSTS